MSMTESFLEKVRNGIAVDKSQIVGYDDEEIVRIERVYNINVAGGLRDFLEEMGRCDGGLIGDDPIILYRPAWTPEGQVAFQGLFAEFMQEDGHEAYLRMKPFVFSRESETQYFFVLTGSENPEMVYRYDENNGTVNSTGRSFEDYIRHVVLTLGG